MIDVISLGAGVQSSAMALMAAEGELTPMPVAAVFADTQDEPVSVYRWLDWLEPRLPFPVHRVTVGRLSDAEVRIRTSAKSGRRYRRGLIPAYLDGGAPVFRHCTQEFKLRPIYRAYRQLFGISARERTLRVRQWIGISLDEAARMKPARQPWVENRWPLVDGGITRQQCLEWFHRRGYPQPPRSACRFCPYHSDAEWSRLKTQEPAEFAEAVAFEQRVQAVCDEVGQARAFLHRTLRPLGEVAFITDQQPDFWQEECEGMCGV